MFPDLPVYSFFLTLALVVTVGGTTFFAHKRKLPWKKVFIVLIVSAVATIVGSRLTYVVTDSAYDKIFVFTAAGFSLYGGMIFAAIAGWLTAKAVKLPVWKLSDTLAPFIGLGIATMRLGCFLYGCCFGKTTALPWGVKYPLLSPAHVSQISENTLNLFSVSPVHPTQLYEMFAALTAGLIAVFIIKKKQPAGVAFLLSVIWFTTWRWIVHYFRVYPDHFQMGPYFFPIIYGTIIILNSIILILKLKKEKNNPL